MLWVRKTHMYLGLVLFPWVLFFGATGILFNHPGIGESIGVRRISAEHLREHTGIAPVDPQEIAREVASRLRAEGHQYRLDDGFKSELHGSTAFAASGAGKKHLVLLDLANGRGIVLTRPDHAADPPPFAGELDIPAHRPRALEPRIAGLLPTLGVNDASGPLRSVLAPTLRFRLLDGEGRAWNATYDLRDGHLDGRLASASPDLRLHDLLGEMHKTHHFPPTLGPTTFWALFADLTGATLIVWALTGLLMWWQLKRTRVFGVVAVSVGLLIAACTMLATHGELRFGNVHPNEPGGASARAPAARLGD